MVDYRVLKVTRDKRNQLLLKQWRPERQVKSLQPQEEGLEEGKIFKYDTFPKFDMSLYYPPRPIDSYQNDEGMSILLKTLLNSETLGKLNDEDWASYLAEVVYILWFQIFTTTLPMYMAHAKELVAFCKGLLRHVRGKKLQKMRDAEIVYRRLFEACGTCRL